jgi:hypothetical protein
MENGGGIIKRKFCSVLALNRGYAKVRRVVIFGVIHGDITRIIPGVIEHCYFQRGWLSLELFGSVTSSSVVCL